jgi:hypothetical protein
MLAGRCDWPPRDRNTSLAATVSRRAVTRPVRAHPDPSPGVRAGDPVCRKGMAVCEVWHREPPRLAGTLRALFSNAPSDLDHQRSIRAKELEKCRRLLTRKRAEQFSWPQFSSICKSPSVYAMHSKSQLFKSEIFVVIAILFVMQGPEYKQAQSNHSSLLSVVAKMLGDEVKPIITMIQDENHE